MSRHLAATPLLLAVCLGAADPPGSGTSLPHFQQSWADEFSQGYADAANGYSQTNAPNPAVWKNPRLDRFNSSETQQYRMRPENVRVENGSLVLQLLTAGVTVSGRSCTSGMAVSRVRSGSYPDAHDFTNNGRIEWRSKIPSGGSMWPALWMEGSTGSWPACGEIDVLEHFGWDSDPTRAFGHGSSSALHWSNASNVHVGQNQVLAIRDPSTDWHIWAVERDANEMLFFFDDILIRRWDITDPAMAELRTLTAFAEMNLAYVGASAAGVDGTKMYVDYVREFAFKPGVRRHYPPVVALGQKEEVLQAVTGRPLRITADASGDGLTGRGFTWEWQQVGGPDASTFADATAQQTTVTFSSAGSYTLRCIARDGQYGGWYAKNVTVSDAAANTPPQITCADRTVKVGWPMRLTTTAVDDGLPSGSLTYSWWNLGDGDVSISGDDTLQPTVTCTSAGSHTIQVTVSDGVLSSHSYVFLTAVAAGANAAPTVSAGTAPVAVAGDPATLAGSVDDDGLPQKSLSQTWSVVSGPATPVFDHVDWAQTPVTFPTAGTYVLRLTVTDGQLSTSADLTVDVSSSGSGNTAPNVNAGADRTITLPATAALSGSATDDGLPANSLGYLWTKSSGPGTVTFASSTSASTTASFSIAGTYVLQLAVSDSALSGTDTVTITVNPVVVVNTAPVANAGADQAITLPATAALNGSATDDGLPGGSSLGYLWTKSSGPGTVTFASSTSASTTASFSIAGIYVLQLAVSDSALSGTDAVTVTVGTAGAVPTTVQVSSNGSGNSGSCGSGALGFLGLSLAMFALNLRRSRSR